VCWIFRKQIKNKQWTVGNISAGDIASLLRTHLSLVQFDDRPQVVAAFSDGAEIILTRINTATAIANCTYRLNPETFG
jgi:hypothetical protein